MSMAAKRLVRRYERAARTFYNYSVNDPAAHDWKRAFAPYRAADAACARYARRYGLALRVAARSDAGRPFLFAVSLGGVPWGNIVASNATFAARVAARLWDLPLDRIRVET